MRDVIGGRSVELADVLRPATVAEQVHPDKSYRNLGIYGFGRGVFAKPDISGQDTSAKTLYRVSGGQFIYSRLFAFEGAYAVVPEQLDGCYVSNEFPTFDWNLKVAVPRFVEWIFKQQGVWSAIAEMGVGLGDRRKRVHPESLLSFRISLPALAEQQRIVKRLDAVATRLKQRADAAARQETELAAMLNASFARINANAPRLPMAEIAPIVKRPVTIDQKELYTEFGIRSFYRGLFQRRTMAGSEFSWQSLYRIAPGDLIFSNIMAWEQAIALVEPEDAHCVGNHRMLTCEPDRSRTVPGFLFYYFTTREGFAQIDAGSPGSIARNKTLSPGALESMQVPIPSLDAQLRFEQLRTKVKAIREHQTAITKDAASLLPAMLDQIFG